MKNYLVLHIDTDFLVGTVCAGENNLSYPIKNKNDECFWFYFYNDPYSNMVSFGKENQKHCGEGKINYYGNFIELIENENNTFSIGEYEYPIIELLRYSKIIEKLKQEFSIKTLESSDSIPTLLTFSLSISELAKQKLVDYLKTQNFNILSYTIPLAELSCYYTLKNNKINYTNGNIVTFMEATNTDLHLLKLMFTSDYFLLDGNTETKKGLGIDPRKRALLKFVVNKIGTMGVLSEQEKEYEYKLMEPKTDEWLHRLDLQTNDTPPVDIIESLSKMPSTKKRVLINKEKIAEFTGSDIKLILNTYNDYVKRNISQDISAIILLGNLFQNDIIKSKFQKLVDDNRLFIYVNKDIQNILSVYPKIDFKRYISEEERIKAKAVAEESKKAEQRALEDKQRKEQEAEYKRREEEKKAEQNRIEAEKFYARAVELDKEGKLQDALVKVGNAIEKDGNNTEYKRFAKELNAKIKEQNDKKEKYKSWYKDAETYEQTDDLESALIAYENAQQIFDSAELRKKIVELKRKIEKQQNEEKIDSFISIAKLLADKGKFVEAVDNIQEALKIDPANKIAKDALKEIYAQQSNKENEKKYKELVNQADKFFKEENFEKATASYVEATKFKSDDEYCSNQLTKIKELVLQKQNQEKADKIVAEADKYFEKELWEDAKTRYEEALKLCPNNKKIQQCIDQLKAIEDAFTDLIFEATVAEKKNKLKEALDFLEKAEKIKPTDSNLRERIKKIKNKLKFVGFGGDVNPTPYLQTDDDGWDFGKEKTKEPKKEDDFLGKEDDFLGDKKSKENPKTEAGDFLGKKIVFCTKCGKQLNLQDKFCINCGLPRKLNW